MSANSSSPVIGIYPNEFRWWVLSTNECHLYAKFIPSLLQLKDVSAGVVYLHDLQPPVCHGDLKSVSRLNVAKPSLTYNELFSSTSSSTRPTVLSSRTLDPVAS